MKTLPVEELSDDRFYQILDEEYEEAMREFLHGDIVINNMITDDCSFSRLSDENPTEDLPF